MKLKQKEKQKLPEIKNFITTTNTRANTLYYKANPQTCTCIVSRLSVASVR